MMDEEGHTSDLTLPAPGVNRLSFRDGNFLIVGVGPDHQRFADLFGTAADGIFDPLGDVRIFLEILLGILAALANANRVIAEPGTRLLDQAGLDAEVEHFAYLAAALAIHDVEFDLLEWRSDLVLDHFHPGGVADDVVAVLDLAGAANVEPDRRIEFQGIAAGRGLGVAIH